MKINTTKGEIDESKLKKIEGSVDNENESTKWVEYYFGDELVHRSAHVRLKQSIVSTSDIGKF